MQILNPKEIFSPLSRLDTYNVFIMTVAIFTFIWYFGYKKLNGNDVQTISSILRRRDWNSLLKSISIFLLEIFEHSRSELRKEFLNFSIKPCILSINRNIHPAPLFKSLKKSNYNQDSLERRPVIGGGDVVVCGHRRGTAVVTCPRAPPVRNVPWHVRPAQAY